MSPAAPTAAPMSTPTSATSGGALVRFVEGIVNEYVGPAGQDSCPGNDLECVGATLRRLKQKPEVPTTYANLGEALLVGTCRTYGDFGVGVPSTLGKLTRTRRSWPFAEFRRFSAWPTERALFRLPRGWL